MANKLKAVQYVTKQNLTKAFGSFEGKMNRRFDRVEGSIDRLAVAVADGFADMGERFTKVDVRFDKLEGKVESLQGDVKSLQGDVQRIDNRLARQQDTIDETKRGNRVLERRLTVVEVKIGIPTPTK